MSNSESSREVAPLAEASPASLDELFSRDPFDLAEADIERIVMEFRRARENWATAEASGAKKAPKAVKAPKAEAPKDLSLDDLGL